jgi:short-subunit dehydrogenase
MQTLAKGVPRQTAMPPQSLVWISGATAGIGWGLARTVPYADAYCAAKAGVEMWVRVVRRELEHRGRKTWVVAVRPGFVDTPTTRMNAEQPADTYPVGPQISRQFQTGESVLTPQSAGSQIWAALPPKANTSLLLFGEMVTERD